MVKKIVSGSIVYGLAPYVPRVASIFLLPYLTSRLTANEYGTIAVITAYTASISVFSTLGFVNLLFSSFYNFGRRFLNYWQRIYGLLLIWSCFFIIFQFLFFYFYLPNEVGSFKMRLIILISLSSFFSSTILIGNTYFQLHSRPLPIAVRTIMFGLMFVILNFYLIVYENRGLIGYFESLAISNLLIGISYIPTIKHTIGLSPIFFIKFKRLKRFLKIVLPEIPHYYSNFLTNSSNRILMERNNISSDQIGKFSIGFQFSSIAESFIMAINQAISPFLYNEIKLQRDKVIKQLLNGFYLTSFFICVFFCFWIKEIFSFLIKNKDLVTSYPFAIVLIMAQVNRPFYFMHNAYYVFYQKTLSVLKISLVSGLLSFFGYLVFIPLSGIMGAVIVYYFSTFYLSYSGFFFKHFKEKSNEKYLLVIYMILPLVASVLLFYVVELEFIFKFVISVVFSLVMFPLIILSFRKLDFK